MTLAALKEFSVSPQQMWESSFPWGGGHTRETDPTRRGWRIRAISAELAVVGRPGVLGCLSVRRMGDGRLDIAMYDEVFPREVDQQLRAKRSTEADAFYVGSPTPGWALPFIRELEAQRA